MVEAKSAVANHASGVRGEALRTNGCCEPNLPDAARCMNGLELRIAAMSHGKDCPNRTYTPL